MAFCKFCTAAQLQLSRLTAIISMTSVMHVGLQKMLLSSTIVHCTLPDIATKSVHEEVTLPGVSVSTCCTSPLPLLCHQTSSRLSRSTVGKSCCNLSGCRPTSDDSQMRSLHNGSTTVAHPRELPKAISAVCRARLRGEAIRISGFGDRAFASTRASVAWAFPSSVNLVSYLPTYA